MRGGASSAAGQRVHAGAAGGGLATELLTIDVDAEIRKVCGRQFASSAEQLVELVRLLLGAAARVVHVRLGRLFVSLTAAGARLPDGAVVALAAAADRGQAPAARHEALLLAEHAAGPAFTSLILAKRAFLVAAVDGRREELRVGASVAPLYDASPSSQPPGVSLRLWRRRDAVDERALLQRACRFSRVPVVIQGEQLGGSLTLPSCLCQAEMTSGSLTLRVGVPRAGELSQTTLICGDVVARESYTVSPRGFVHVAAVRDERARSAADVDWEHVTETVRLIRGRLYDHLAARYETFSRDDRRAVRELLFRRCERSRELEAIAGLKLFHRSDGASVDIEALQRAAAERGLWAVEPRARPRPWLVPAASIFVLDDRERDLLARVAGILCQPPPRARDDALFGRAKRAAGRAAQRLGRSLMRALSLWRRSRAIPASRLTPPERALLEAVRGEVASGHFRLPTQPSFTEGTIDVQMSERGALPVRLQRTSTGFLLVLPRRHPRLALMTAAFARDPRTLPAILAALCAGHDGYGARKEAWHDALLVGARRGDSAATPPRIPG